MNTVPLIAILLSVMLGGCRYSHVDTASIEVTGGDTVNERVALARSVLAPSEVSRMVGQIKMKVPAASQDELSRVGFSAKVVQHERDPAKVFISVVVRDVSPSTSQDILAAASQLIRSSLDKQLVHKRKSSPDPVW